ncbi:unnamed protein product [Auanema sp. JU1783]|nr:unnamed protein product [Auanema sp. JU1783]
MTFGSSKVDYRVHAELGHLYWLAGTVAVEAKRLVCGGAIQEENHFLGQMEDLQDACLKAAKVREQADISTELAAWGLPTSAEGLCNMVLQEDGFILRDLHLEVSTLKEQLAEKKRVMGVLASQDWKKRGEGVRRLLG